MNPLPGQMELANVILHERVSILKDVNVTASNSTTPVDLQKPLGVRLAKMLRRYDDSPSSDLWRDIQSLSAEILR